MFKAASILVNAPSILLSETPRYAAISSAIGVSAHLKSLSDLAEFGFILPL